MEDTPKYFVSEDYIYGDLLNLEFKIETFKKYSFILRKNSNSNSVYKSLEWQASWKRWMPLSASTFICCLGMFTRPLENYLALVSERAW